MSAESAPEGEADDSNTTESKEFSCDYCDTQVSSQPSKRRHEKNFHSDKLEYECPTCGDKFHTLAGRNGHHTTVHGESIAGEKTTCKYCGDTYHVARSELERSNFCSKDCLYDWRSECQTGEEHPLHHRVTVECSNCKSELERFPYQIKQFDRVFCDIECKASWQSENIVGENHHRWKNNTTSFTCEYCGGEYENQERQEGRTRFCSQECITSWQSKNLSGKDSVHYQGGGLGYYGPNWRMQRRKARKRDRYSCQVCGRDERQLGKIPSCHHITKMRYFKEKYDAPEWYERGNRLDNLVLLCEEHHKEWEGIPLRPQ